MVVKKLLLAYNFTPSDQKMIEFVTRTFSGREDTDVTLFHAYAPVPEIKAEDSSVMGRMKANLRYLTQMISEKEKALEDAGQELARKGFRTDRVHCLSKPRKKDLAAEIIDLATAGHFDIVVMSHKPGRVTRFFAASTYNKVISGLEGVTVCVVS